jgi:hypothetical protein
LGNSPSCTPWTRDSSGAWQACESPRISDSRASQTQPTWHGSRIGGSDGVSTLGNWRDPGGSKIWKLNLRRYELKIWQLNIGEGWEKLVRLENWVQFPDVSLVLFKGSF